MIAVLTALYGPEHEPVATVYVAVQEGTPDVGRALIEDAVARALLDAATRTWGTELSGCSVRVEAVDGVTELGARRTPAP